jgi:hypothetical protein
MQALLAAAALLQVQVRDDPKSWRLLESPNFDVYYPSEELLPRAREFAGWFEQARAELVHDFGVEPRRVHVFLYRSFHDLLQSSFLSDFRKEPLSRKIRRPEAEDRRESEPCVTCRPNPHSRALALAEPLRDRIFIHCQASDRWNRWFIKHELAHHVQYEHLFPWRMPGWLIALKHPLTPAWFWEGGADWMAGIFDSGKDQYVRDLAQERLYDLKELFFPDVLNPYDYLSIYYQGSYFWRFLEEEYGVARKVWDRYDRLNFASTRPVQSVTGKERVEVEEAFAASLRRRWEPLMKDRTAPADRLTDSRAYYRRRSWGGRWSPDGTRLAWVGNRDTWPELYVDGQGVLGLRRGVFVGDLVSAPSWSPDGKRLAVIEWYTNRDNLLLVGADGGVESITLPFDELYDPAWSPDGKSIAFAGLKHGTSDLYLYHLADGRVERLTEDSAADSGPAWSGDGRLAWIKETEGRTVLHVRGQGPVTKSWALLEYPQWRPDGKAIAVAADVGGVYDAFEVDPATGKARRLTRFRGGVSHPQYHPSDGTLLFTYYEGRGQDLYRVKAEPQDEPGFDEEGRQPWYEPFKKPPLQGSPAEKSRVWGVDWLMFPVLSSSLLTPGLEFSAGDRDAENSIDLFATGMSHRSWSASGVVSNTRWRPTIGAAAGVARDDDLYEARGEPFLEIPIYTTLSTGFGWVGRYRKEYEDDFPDPHVFDSGPEASFRWSTLRRYSLKDDGWGFALGGSAAVFDEHYGGDRDLNEYFAFFECVKDLAQDWTFWTRTTYEKLVGGPFLRSELLELEDVIRGARDLELIERGAVSVELRFPICRDLLWQPLEFIGLGEWLILKDLRGFVFGQAGFVGLEPQDALDDDFGAASTGLGLRLDLSIMVWPIVNARAPVRLEFWWALVGQDEDDPRGAVGGGFQVGF